MQVKIFIKITLLSFDSSLQNGNIAGQYFMFSFTNGYSKTEEDST